ncbi:MAG: winged helix-turn-helix domain-containing protein [Acidobacteria bacterium]|nr:winged helix-turn-helix domain-containing protein [Acidobacteriota bacterium]
MNESQTHIYEFGNFRLCAAKRLLLKGVDEIVPLMPKAFDTLLYLVRHNGKVIEKDELMREIWADTIVEENNLTQNISILRRVFGEKPGEHRFIVTVPGHGYKFVAEVVESPKPQVPSPKSDVPDEIKPDGIAEHSEAEREKLETWDLGLETNQDQGRQTENQIARNERQKTKDEKTNRFWLVAGFSAFIIGLSLLGFYSWRGNEKSVAAPIKTVAVLPFKSLVAEKRDESLELGMADTLISKLSGGEEITVRPLSAIRRYNSVEQDSLIAGRELNVEAVLDGTIQTSGERIRVSAKLLRTGDGKQLWTGQFDEKFTDIFAVQDSISERVAAALKIRFGNAEKKRPTENVEAYQLYMKGRYHALNLTRTETDKGIAYFQQAIEIDPNYALAYAGIANAYLPMALTSGVPSWEVMPKAKAAALRAVEIDETLAEAHAVLGYTIFWYDWNWQAAEKEYLRALELNPNSAEAHFGYAHLLSNVARHAPALAEIKLSRELDPTSLRTNALEGQILFFAGKNDEALDRLNKTIDLNPNFWLSHLFISRVYTEKGMHAEAVAAAKKAGEISGNSQSEAYRAYALARWGKQAEARAVLDELLKLSNERYVPPYNFAVVYNGLGESDKALDYLEKAFLEKDVRMVFLKVEPKWNNLRSEPRFIDLMRRMNF